MSEKPKPKSQLMFKQVETNDKSQFRLTEFQNSASGDGVQLRANGEQVNLAGGGNYWSVQQGDKWSKDDGLSLYMLRSLADESREHVN